MDEKLYSAFMKEFAWIIDHFQVDVADAMEINYNSYLYEYYHSKYKLDTDESEDAMWQEFWADFDKVFNRLFKDYIS